MANFLGNLNPDMLMAISSGLLTGRNPQEQIGGALGGFAQVRKDQRQKNATMDWLQKNSPDLLPMLDAGMSPSDLVSIAYKEKLAAQKAQQPNRQWVQLPDGQYGWADKNSGEFSPIGTAVKPGTGEGGDEWGLNPVWGTDASGKTGIGQMSKSGKFKLLDTGDFSPSPGINTIDTGPTIVTRNNRTGETISETPKDLAEAERQKQIGKGQGEAAATYNSMMSKMPGLEQVVGELDQLADKATYTMAGRTLDAGMAQLGMDPRDAAIARAEYIAKVDNQILPLLRDTFGAQFTQREGETLRATLGDPSMTPAEKKAVLRSFIQQKRRDVEALALQGMNSGGGSPQGGQQAGQRTNSGIQWSVEP